MNMKTLLEKVRGHETVDSTKQIERRAWLKKAHDSATACQFIALGISLKTVCIALAVVFLSTQTTAAMPIQVERLTKRQLAGQVVGGAIGVGAGMLGPVGDAAFATKKDWQGNDRYKNPHAEGIVGPFAGHGLTPAQKVAQAGIGGVAGAVHPVAGLGASYLSGMMMDRWNKFDSSLIMNKPEPKPSDGSHFPAGRQRTPEDLAMINKYQNARLPDNPQQAAWQMNRGMYGNQATFKESLAMARKDGITPQQFMQMQRDKKLPEKYRTAPQMPVVAAPGRPAAPPQAPAVAPGRPVAPNPAARPGGR